MTRDEFTKRFLVGNYLEPDRAGEKHLLFSYSWDKTLVEALMEPKPPEIKIWKGGFEEFVKALDQWMDQGGHFLFHITVHDCAVSEVDWSRAVDRPMELWLGCFELNADSQGGPQQLCLVPSAGNWIVVLERAVGFEIAFFGQEEDWQSLKAVMDRSM